MSELVGRSAPDFQLQTPDGAPISLFSMRGTPVLLNVFHSGCPWCRAEMPKLVASYQRHTDVGVRILGLAVGKDTPETVRAFAQETGLNFPVAVDEGGNTRLDYPLGRVPSIVAIDRSGIIVRVYEGWAEQLPGIVEQTLMALARDDELPEYSLIGNGCAL